VANEPGLALQDQVQTTNPDELSTLAPAQSDTNGTDEWPRALESWSDLDLHYSMPQGQDTFD